MMVMIAKTKFMMMITMMINVVTRKSFQTNILMVFWT